MKNTLNFLLSVIKTNFRLSLSRKTDLLFSIIAGVIIHLANILTWNEFFRSYKEINGWTIHDLILLKGLLTCSVASVNLLFKGLRDIPQIVSYGLLDTYIVQPKNTLLKLAVSKFDVSALGDLMLGFAMIGYSGYATKLPFYVLGFITLGVFYFFGFYVVLGSIAFFFRGSISNIEALRILSGILCSQPVSGYTGIVKIVTMTILPVAYVAFFPIEFLRTLDVSYLLISVMGVFSLFFFSIALFGIALRRYESGSTMMAKVA